jgi:flavin reductase (DIM6/NTAB) family NADH-FMN oxidoreductase RutF
MENKNIAIKDLVINPYQLFEDHWLLLTSGNYDEACYNTMTISWGSIGQIWSKMFVQVVVRPSRYTYQFINNYPTFTLSAFPSTYRKALALLGEKSGRDGDKIKISGLTPIPSHTVAAPGFTEANLILECEKMYWDDMQVDHFLNPSISTQYPEKDYHRIFYGEIKAIYGDAAIYTRREDGL